MFMQIVDSGASDMRRTEAKEVLEGLQSRLLYSVRTRPPQKKNIFGEEETYEGERKGMQEFLAAWKVRKRRAESEVSVIEEGGGWESRQWSQPAVNHTYIILRYEFTKQETIKRSSAQSNCLRVSLYSIRYAHSSVILVTRRIMPTFYARR